MHAHMTCSSYRMIGINLHAVHNSYPGAEGCSCT